MHTKHHDFPKNIFITGIGTDVGKTIASAILTEALEADYWKPVQSGLLEQTDTERVAELITNTRTHLHPERYRFVLPASPHYAAEQQGIIVDPHQIVIPETPNRLIIEGAGGAFVPLNYETLFADWVAEHSLPTIIVSRYYLGSINHTLLTVEALRYYSIPILGIIFNGDESPEHPSSVYIERMTQIPVLLRIAEEPTWDKATIRKYAERFNAP